MMELWAQSWAKINLDFGKKSFVDFVFLFFKHFQICFISNL